MSASRRRKRQLRRTVSLNPQGELLAEALSRLDDRAESTVVEELLRDEAVRRGVRVPPAHEARAEMECRADAAEERRRAAEEARFRAAQAGAREAFGC